MSPRNTDAPCTYFEVRWGATRNASARCRPEGTGCPRAGKRCKDHDTRSARIPQAKVFIGRQVDLPFADCNWDFDLLWLAGLPRRGCWRLSGVGRNFR